MQTDFFYRLSRPYGITAVWFVLRVWLGASAISHGIDEVFGAMPSFIRHLALAGVPLPELVGYSIVFFQVVGGAAVVIGVLTRPFAFALMLISLATLYEQLFLFLIVPSVRAIELAFTYSLLGGAFVLCGPGRFSIDFFLARRYLKSIETQQNDASLRDVYNV